MELKLEVDPQKNLQKMGKLLGSVKIEMELEVDPQRNLQKRENCLEACNNCEPEKEESVFGSVEELNPGKPGRIVNM